MNSDVMAATGGIPTPANVSSVHTTNEAAQRVRARALADRRLRLYGLLAIGFAVAMLFLLLWSVFGRAANTLTEHYAAIEMEITKDAVDPENTDDPEIMARADFTGMVKERLKELYPSAAGRRQRSQLYGLISDGAADDLRSAARAGELSFDESKSYPMLFSDDVELYLGGRYGKLETIPAAGALSILTEGNKAKLFVGASSAFRDVTADIKIALRNESDRLRRQADRQDRGVRVTEQRLENLQGAEAEAARNQIEAFAARRDLFLSQAVELDQKILAASSESLALSPQISSYFVKANGGTFKLDAVSATDATATVLIPPESDDEIPASEWSLKRMESPEAGRKISDLQIAIVEDLRRQGKVSEEANWRFLSKGDSREAELAGIKGAVVGSLWTMLVTFFLAFPTGVLAAIYLEEFAPKNRLTDFIEVNINNLAAVPSIVFGLLGLAVFVTFFGVPRSTPLAGGIVLALMTLPTIVIASRAALRAVPPSIRDAAMGLGASRVQTVFHHVLPLAMPGILTGSIIGMAQALGETAPLLLIGMVAFITSVPEGVTDSATVLPVQVFIWANQSEQAFDYRTAAAIVVLLGFLIIMNLIAIVLRKRFERRW